MKSNCGWKWASSSPSGEPGRGGRAVAPPSSWQQRFLHCEHVRQDTESLVHPWNIIQNLYTPLLIWFPGRRNWAKNSVCKKKVPFRLNVYWSTYDPEKGMTGEGWLNSFSGTLNYSHACPFVNTRVRARSYWTGCFDLSSTLLTLDCDRGSVSECDSGV